MLYKLKLMQQISSNISLLHYGHRVPQIVYVPKVYSLLNYGHRVPQIVYVPKVYSLLHYGYRVPQIVYVPKVYSLLHYGHRVPQIVYVPKGVFPSVLKKHKQQMSTRFQHFSIICIFHRQPI